MSHFFIPMRRVLQSILNLDLDTIALEIASTPTFKKLVISLNTEGQPTSQLFELGVNSEGRTLESIGGGYSPFTIEEKKKKGQRFDHVTLKDTGEFYKSFNVIPYKGGFKIEADPIKDETNLFSEWGEDIVGLTEENINIIIEYYRNELLKKVQNIVKAA